MTVLAQVGALIGAAVHILAFVWETLLFRRPAIHQGVFRVPTQDVPAVLLWSFNVGVYNLCVGVGAVVGVGLWWYADETAGRTLVLFTCAFMAVAGVALWVSDRLALSRPRGSGVVGSIVQTVPGLIGVIGVAGG